MAAIEKFNIEYIKFQFSLEKYCTICLVVLSKVDNEDNS